MPDHPYIYIIMKSEFKIHVCCAVIVILSRFCTDVFMLSCLATLCIRSKHENISYKVICMYSALVDYVYTCICKFQIKQKIDSLSTEEPSFTLMWIVSMLRLK